MPIVYKKKFPIKVIQKRPKVTVSMTDNAQTKMLLSLKRKVNHLAKTPEVKFFDTEQGVTGTPQTVAYNFNNSKQLDAISQSTATAVGKNQREGDSIRPFYLTIRGSIFQNAAHTTQDTVRIILIRCKKGNGFVPNIGSTTTGKILQYQGAAQAVWSPIQYDNKTEFTVLHDQTFVLQGSNTTANTRNFVINKKLSGTVDYVAGTTTPEGGSLYFQVIASTPTGSNPPSMLYNARLYYTDP